MEVLYKYVSAERALKCLPEIGNGTLRATQPLALNDPFECSAQPYVSGAEEEQDYVISLETLNNLNPKTPIDESEFREAIELSGGLHIQDLVRRQLSQRFGIVSFASNPLHPLMWAHYTTDGSGFVIGYGLSYLEELVHEHELEFLHPVEYSAEPPILPNCDVINYDGVILFLLLTKSCDWKYEGEWRLIKSLRNTIGTGKKDDKGQPINLISIPNEAVVEVYYTERTPNESVKAISKRLREENNRFGVCTATRLLLAKTRYEYKKESK